MKSSNNSLHSLFVCLLRRMHTAEQDIYKQLEILSGLAKQDRLKLGLKKHMQDTQSQIERLEKALKLLEEQVEEKKEGLVENAMEILEKGKEIATAIVSMSFVPKSPSIQGIVKEGKDLFEEFEDTNIHDLVLSTGLQTIEKGEIAAYTTLCQIAEQCGHREILELLQTSLKEEEYQSNLVSQITEQDLKTLAKAS